MKACVERLKRYVSYETTSDEGSDACPSSQGQVSFGALLVKELKEMGLTAVRQDAYGYVYATLEKNAEGFPVIGLIAHMDTSPEAYGRLDDPQIIDYQGGEIPLNDQISLTESEFPFLSDLRGQTLMTTRAESLLGADDKAGIAIIMSVVEELIHSKETPHGTVQIAFTPDEEIGRGADHFDVEAFGADFAFTVDGGPAPGFEYETFNAASAKIRIQGKNVHTGSAKNTMISAVEIAMDLHSLLPCQMKAHFTEGREGFYHLLSLEGNVVEARLSYLIREHDRAKFEKMKAYLTSAVALINQKYGIEAALDLTDTYYNMKEKIEAHPEILDRALRAYQQVGLQAQVLPVRGGTDGAGLSFKGLPTPNLFTGGYNYHGIYEFISLDQMAQACAVVKAILTLKD